MLQYESGSRQSRYLAEIPLRDTFHFLREIYSSGDMISKEARPNLPRASKLIQNITIN